MMSESSQTSTLLFGYLTLQTRSTAVSTRLNVVVNISDIFQSGDRIDVLERVQNVKVTDENRTR